MLEGFSSPTPNHERADGRMLRDVRSRLETHMRTSGLSYEIQNGKNSLSLHADAENFAPLLSHLETLIAEANTEADAHHGAHPLKIVVRGMHEVDIQLTSV